MKKIIIFTALLFAISTSFAIESIFFDQKVNLDTFVLVETVVQSWKDSVWENSARGTCDYDSKARVTLQIGQRWESGSWINRSKDIRFYENNTTNIKRKVMSLWENNDWVVSQEELFTYDSTRKLKEHLFSTSSRDLYDYDKNDNLMTKIHQQFDITNLFWSTTQRDTFCYDQYNNLIIDLTQDWKDQAWHNKMRFKYSYDSNNKNTEIIFQNWSQDSSWVSTQKEIVTYNSIGLRKESIDQYWYEGKWDNMTKLIYNYNTNNYLKEELSYSWVDAGWKLRGKSIHVYKKMVVPIKNITKSPLISTHNFKMMPKGIYLETLQPKPRKLILSIFNIQGKRIVSLRNPKILNNGLLFTWDKSDFTNNAYVLVVQNGSGLIVAKSRMVVTQ